MITKKMFKIIDIPFKEFIDKNDCFTIKAI
jgi:hypothetical protein